MKNNILTKLNLVTQATVKEEKTFYTVRKDYLPPSPTLRQKFLDLGYPAFWRKNEGRFLTKELAREVESKDGILALARDDAKESIIPNLGTTPPPKSLEDKAKEYKGHKLVRVVALKNYTNGTFALDMNYFGYPCAWEKHEIREIADTLLKKLNAGQLTTDPEQIKQWEYLAPKFKMHNDQWKAEQEAARQKALNPRR